MTGRRIDFPPKDPARFNALRDQWRGAAASLPLSRSAMRIATVLPTYVSREFGYAFPTDDDLRGVLNASKETVKRGLADLERADLLERETRIKRDANREAVGRERRIFLCFPTVRSERTVAESEGSDSSEVKGQRPNRGEGSTRPEVKGQEVKGQAEVKGQKSRGEGSYGGPNIPDTYTPDFGNRSGDKKVSVYEGEGKTDPSPLSASSPVTLVRRVAPSLRPALQPALPKPPGWGDDLAFLDAFDGAVQQLAGADVPAGSIERIVGTAFDLATNSSPDNMPVFWADMIACRTTKVADGFRARASALIHRRVAA